MKKLVTAGIVLCLSSAAFAAPGSRDRDNRRDNDRDRHSEHSKDKRKPAYKTPVYKAPTYKKPVYRAPATKPPVRTVTKAPAKRIEYRPPIVIRDHREPVRPVFSVLSGSQSLWGRTSFNLWSQSAYATLKLQASAGFTFVDRVVITFGNGQTQTLTLRRWVGGRLSPLSIDLDGNRRFITNVMVYGWSGYASSIQLFGAK